MKRPVGVLVAALALSACATVPPVRTPSGQPEITLSNIDPVCVRARFLNGFVNGQFTIRTTNDSQIVAGKPSNNLAANVLLGTRGGGFPEDRVTALFIALPMNGMRIVVSEAYVSNAGTGFEQVTPIQQAQAVQDQFATLGDRAQMTCARAP